MHAYEKSVRRSAWHLVFEPQTQSREIKIYFKKLLSFGVDYSCFFSCIHLHGNILVWEERERERERERKRERERERERERFQT